MKTLLFIVILPAALLQNTCFAQSTSPSLKSEVQIEIEPLRTNREFPPEQVGVRQNGNLSTANRNQASLTERTLSIIKPDAVKNHHIGEIIALFENSGLAIVGIKMTQLNKEQAAQFYRVHEERPFFPELVQFMSSGPIVAMVIEGSQAVAKSRAIMGATDPKKAAPGTIRARFAESMSRNAIHGSDSPKSAQEEIQFFFQPDELYQTSLKN